MHRIATLAIVSLLTGSMALPATTAAATERPLTQAQRETVARWATDTWTSMAAMVFSETGLPADNIDGSLDPATRSRYTSPTNIGAYMWSALVARDLGIITRADAYARISTALTTLAHLKHHTPSGMFYNWYDPATGDVLRVWPPDGSTVLPFLSSVDNGWLAASLLVVRAGEPDLAGMANQILTKMNFGFYYDPHARGATFPAGLLRGGFWDEQPPGCSIKGNYPGIGPDVWYTCNTYDVTVTEPRIATYLGIAFGQIPRQAYFATYRTFPSSCDWSWVEQRPVGFTATYLGVPVYEGAFQYRGMRIVPSWGGDMFEALMPDLFVPEETWGPNSWGVNHPATVRAQIEHGMDEAGYGYWGFSPASDPRGGYTAWGVDLIGSNPEGYYSDLEGTNVDIGYTGCRPATNPTPTFGDGVVTPHAAFLAMRFAPQQAFDDLSRIETDLHAYGVGGFYDAVAVKSGTIAKRYLALDQGMVMGAIGNQLDNDLLRRTFIRGPVQDVIKPLLGIETFNASLGN
jgi:Protein of unknown function (DUF3131)./Uncharacterized protein conserved in bacteria (DUF2329).